MSHHHNELISTSLKRTLRHKAKDELERNAKLQEELAAKRKANEGADGGGEMEAALDVGDAIPHFSNAELGLEKQFAMWRTLRRILDVLGEGLRRAKGRSEALLPKDRPQGIFSDRSVLRWDFRNVGIVSVAVHSCKSLLTLR